MAVTYDLSSAAGGFDGTGTATSVQVTLGAAVSVGDAIIFAFTWQSSATISGVTDSLGNTYNAATPDISFTNTGEGTKSVIISCISVTHAGTPTITCNLTGGATGTLNDFGAVRLTNGGSGIVAGNTASNQAGSGTSATTSAVANPAGACAIEWTGQTSGNYLASGPFTQIVSSAIISDCLAGDNLSTAGTISASAAVNPSAPWSIGLVVYVPSIAAASGNSSVVFSASTTATLTGTSAVSTYASAYIPQFAKLGDFDPTALALTWFDGTEDVGGWWDRVDIPSGPAGAIVGASGVVFTTSGTLTGAGAITGSSGVVFTAAGTLVGAGALAGSAAAVFSASATPALQAAANVIFAAQATPSLSGACAVIFAASATPSIIGSSGVIFNASGTLVGVGALAGESDVVFTTSATGQAIGAISGSSAAVFSTSATIAAAGALLGESDAIFTTAGTLTLWGSSAVVFTAQASLGLVGSSAVIFTAGGTLTAVGALAGESDAVFSAQATPTIAGQSAAVFATAATPGGAGALAALSSAVFAAAAAPSGAGAVVGSSTVVFTAQTTPTLSASSQAVFATSGSMGGGAISAESDVVFATSGTIGGAAPVAVAGELAWGGRGKTAPSRKRFRTAADVARDADELEEETLAETPPAEAREDEGPPTYTGPLVFKGEGRIRVAPPELSQRAHGTASHAGIGAQGFDPSFGQVGTGTSLHRGIATHAFDAAAVTAQARADAKRERDLGAAELVRNLAIEELEGRFAAEKRADAARAARERGEALALAAQERQDADALAAREREEFVARADAERQDAAAREAALVARIDALEADRVRQDAAYQATLDAAQGEARGHLETIERMGHDAAALRQELVDVAARADAAAQAAETQNAALSSELRALTEAQAKSEADHRDAIDRAATDHAAITAKLEAARRDADELREGLAAGSARAAVAEREAEASDRRIMAMVDALTRAWTAKDAQVTQLSAELAAERARPTAPPVVHEVEVVRQVEVESPAQAAKIAELTQRLIAAHADLARALETIEALRGRATADAEALTRAIVDARAFALEETDRADAAEARAHDLTGRLEFAENRAPEVRIVADQGLKADNDRLTRRIVALMNVPPPEPEIRTVERVVRVAVEDSTRVERLQAELEKRTAEAKAARKLAGRMYLAHLHAAAIKPPDPPPAPFKLTAKGRRVG